MIISKYKVTFTAFIDAAAEEEAAYTVGQLARHMDISGLVYESQVTEVVLETRYEESLKD